MLRESVLWAKREGEWKRVYWQATPIRNFSYSDITIKGLRFHYLEWPNEGAPAMLVIPGHGGGGGCAEGVTPFASAMRDRYHVYAMEPRGQCDSE